MNTAAAIWIGAGLVTALLEIVAPGVFLLWVGLGAVAAGLLTAVFGLGTEHQVVAFVALTVGFVAFAATRVRRRRPNLVNAPASGLIGQRCRAVAFRDGEGRVSLADGTWSARATDGATPEAGQALTVVGLDGTTLLVAASNI